MNQKLPIIEHLHAQRDDRGRADVLLRCPDSVILKYAEVFASACRHASFPAGEAFVTARVATMLATRSEAGALPGGLAMQVEELRAALTAYAAGARMVGSSADPPPSVTDL